MLFIYFRLFPFPTITRRLRYHKLLPVHLRNEIQETVKQMLVCECVREKNEKFKDLGSFNLLFSSVLVSVYTDSDGFRDTFERSTSIWRMF